MNQLSIFLLGSFQVHLDGRPLSGFAYDKVRALLAYLAVESNRPHSREKLAALLWPDQSPESSRTSLRQALATLRRALCDQDSTVPVLLLDQGSLQVNPVASIWLDMDVLQQELNASQSHSHTDIETCQTCVQHLETGVAYYRGDFLEGLLLGDGEDFEIWTLAKRELLRLQALTAFHHLTNHYIRRGQYAQAQTYAFRQLEIEPYREEAYQQLMCILARSGQRSAALAQYEACRRILADELGVVPARETLALYERIRSTGETRPNNLPLPLSVLIGREDEITTISERLAHPECRLLTLTGMGGIGKTSLALHIAAEHLGDFLQGTYFVSLTALQHPDQVLATITDTLNIPVDEQLDIKTRLLNYLREKSLLLVLDNFEHLLTHPTLQKPDGNKGNTRPRRTGANELLDLVNEMLLAAPHLKLLVTSRERLNVQTEWIIPIEGLPYPDEPGNTPIADLPGYASIRLFVKRAQRVTANFSPTEDDYRHIARICQLNRGIPLGVQLAAGWMESLSCQTIASEIQADLDFLATSLYDVPDRHQSLATVFEHSWGLLSATEQAVLYKLSIFLSPFQHVAAREVAGAGHHHLVALVNKSFLNVEPGGRYDLHPLLKMFLRQKLEADSQEQTATESRYAAYYAGFMQAHEAALLMRQDPVALTEVSAEIEDVRAAWNWAVAKNDLDFLSKALNSMDIFYWARNRFREGQTAFADAIETLTTHEKSTPQSLLLLERLRCRDAEFIAWLGDLETAQRQLQTAIDAIRHLQDDEELIYALNLLGMINYWIGDFSPARDVSQEAILISRRLQSRHNLAQALVVLANVICDETSDYQAAEPLYTESLALYRELDNPNGVAKVLVNQGAIFYELGDYKQAKSLYEQSLQTYRQVEYPRGIAAVINNLALVARSLGDLEEARELLAESLSIKRAIGNPNAILHSLLEIGAINTTMGMYTEAHNCFHEALLLAQETKSINLLHHILVGKAELYIKQGKMEPATVLVTFVLLQEGLVLELVNKAKSLLTDLEIALPIQTLAQYQRQAKTRTLQDVVMETLADFHQSTQSSAYH